MIFSSCEWAVQCITRSPTNILKTEIYFVIIIVASCLKAIFYRKDDTMIKWLSIGNSALIWYFLDDFSSFYHHLLDSFQKNRRKFLFHKCGDLITVESGNCYDFNSRFYSECDLKRKPYTFYLLSLSIEYFRKILEFAEKITSCTINKYECQYYLDYYRISCNYEFLAKLNRISFG